MLGKNIDDCHRKRVGEWLKEGGYKVEEFVPKRIERPQEKQLSIFPSLA